KNEERSESVWTTSFKDGREEEYKIISKNGRISQVEDFLDNAPEVFNHVDQLKAFLQTLKRIGGESRLTVVRQKELPSFERHVHPKHVEVEEIEEGKEKKPSKKSASTSKAKHKNKEAEEADESESK